MDIRETEAEAEVRRRFRRFLAEVLPSDYGERVDDYRKDLALRRAYQVAAFEAGWLMPSFEPGLGGQGLGPLETLTVRLEEARAQAPKLPNIQGPHVVAPGIRRYGTPEQKARYLVPLLRGEEWWALGMSEPEAGSDFANLRTRARLSEGRFVVEGQKIWTTQAHESRFMTLYCRTDPDAERHAGISCLIVDLSSPGVTVRPIPMAALEDEGFCEVFLDGVEVPADALLGGLGQGWEVAMTSLTHERDMIWVMNSVDVERGLRRAAALLSEHGCGPHTAELEAELGRRVADALAVRFTGYRAVTKALRGETSAEFLILKLLGSEALQRTWDLVLAASGPGAAARPELVAEDLAALPATIYGGTSEIQRDIVGDRVLGLPRSR